MSKKITLSLSDKNRPNLLELFQGYMRNRKVNRSRRRIGGGLLIDIDDEEYAEVMDYWDQMFPGWDEDDYPREDDCDVVFPPMKLVGGNKGSRRKDDAYRQYWDQEEREERWARNLMGKSAGRKKKHKRHGKGNRSRMVDIHRPMDGYIGNDDYNLDDIHYVNAEDDVSNAKIIFYPDYHDREKCVCFWTLVEFSDFCEQKGYFVPGYVADDILYRGENHCCINPIAKEKGILEILSEASYGEMFYEVCKPEELQ